MTLFYHASRMWDVDPPFPIVWDPVEGPFVVDDRWPPAATLPFGIHVRLEEDLDSATMGAMAPPCLVMDGHGGFGKPPAAVVALAMASSYLIDIKFSGSGSDISAEQILSLGQRVESDRSGNQTWLPATPVASLSDRYWRRPRPDDPVASIRPGATCPLWEVRWTDAWRDDEGSANAYIRLGIWDYWPARHMAERLEPDPYGIGRYSGIAYWPNLDKWTVGPAVFHIVADGGEAPQPLAEVNPAGGPGGWRGERMTAEGLFVGADYEYWSVNGGTLTGTITVEEFLNRV